jgi:hypothetical protein
MAHDITYYWRRAAEERQAAMRATDLRVKRLHLQLAERYDHLVASIETQHRLESSDFKGAA